MPDELWLPATGERLPADRLGEAVLHGHLKQVDWLPGEGGAADFFAMTLQPGEHFDAPLGFQLEQSGYAKGFAIYVTLDQPGSGAYPAKFLYAPPMG